jgi:tripartite-type tricarboxylate transporter receptor subunit TctC
MRQGLSSFTQGLLVLAMLALCGPYAFAQTYPIKVIRLVVPFPPGGAAEVVARPTAQKLSETFGQQVVIDNRGGAAGTIGAGLVAKSPPDGYTLLLGTSNELCMSPPLYSKLPYDPTTDFAPITPINIFPNILVVNPSLPVKTAKEFVALIRSRPGQVGFASAGPGSSNHLTGEIFKSLLKVNINHIPYKGGGPALTDVMGGHVEAIFATSPSAVTHIRSGKLKPLLVTSEKRSPTFPEVPTSAEAGIPGLVVSTWNGVLAPAGTPRDIIARLHAEIVKLAHTADMKQRMDASAAEIYTLTPEQFAELIRRDYAKWSKVVKESGTKLD